MKINSGNSDENNFIGMFAVSVLLGVCFFFKVNIFIFSEETNMLIG